ncbi:MAG: hypothetical protein JWP01_1884 [Myxococcales bacterium]|nr:hypothetical protein [Myxococcales bacterium]
MSAVPSSEIAGTQRKKHRHDLGHEDHGPKVAEGTTRAIQTILGLWIALTLGLVIYVLVDGSRPRTVIPTSAPTSTTPATH